MNVRSTAHLRGPTLKPLVPGFVFHDLQFPFACGRAPGSQLLPAIGAICPNLLQTGHEKLEPYELSINARIGGQLHSLSNAGSNGSNCLYPRHQLLATGEETDACSGQIARHSHASLFAEYAEAAGCPLCLACQERDGRRAVALIVEIRDMAHADGPPTIGHDPDVWRPQRRLSHRWCKGLFGDKRTDRLER